MAIPFVVPSDDQAETNLTKLLCDLIEINQQVQILLRSRVQNGPQPVVFSRVYMSPRHLRIHQNVGEQMPDLVNNLPFASVTNNRTNIVIPGSQNFSTVSSRHRSRRQRTSSESSCCEQSKYCVEDGDVTEDPIVVSTSEIDWSQVGVIIQRVADDSLKPPAASKDDESDPLLPLALLKGTKLEAKSILSKFLPTSTSSCSIWTAIICGVVGWHIFRGR